MTIYVRRAALASVFILTSLLCNAQGVGTTDYNQGSDALYNAFNDLCAFIYYFVRFVNALAAILAVISATQIYIKMNNGEDGILKSIQMLFWSVIFLLAANIVFPMMFGFNYTGGNKLW